MENNKQNNNENEGFIEIEEQSGRIILKEADGSENVFIFDSELEVGEKRYIILIPEEELETEDDLTEQEAVVFRIEEDENGDEIWTTIDDEEELALVEEALFNLDSEDDDLEE